MRVIPLGIHYEHPIIFRVKGKWDIFTYAVFGTASQEGVELLSRYTVTSWGNSVDKHQWGLTAFGLALSAKSEYEMEWWWWEHSFTVGKPCECVLGDGFRATSSAKAPLSHLRTSSMFSCSCSPPHTLQKVQCLQLQILPTISRNYTTSPWVFCYCYKGPCRGRFCCKKQSSRTKTHRVKWGGQIHFFPSPSLLPS